MKGLIYEVPTKDNSSATWITWHKALRKEFGKKRANELFMRAWDRNAGAGSTASTNELRSYMKGQGIALDTTWTEDASDFGSSVGDTFSSIMTMNRYFMIGIGVIVLGGTGMLIFNIAKSPEKVAGAIKLI